MKFKDDDIKNEFEGAPLLLQIMANDFDSYSRAYFQKEPVLTRVLEAIPGDSSVHEDYRAVDIRQEHEGALFYTPDEEKELLNYINKKYYRNDDKPSIICHSFNGSPYHFHLQIAVFTKVYMVKP